MRLCLGSALLKPATNNTLQLKPADNDSGPPTCNDGGLATQTLNMGLLSKAKLASKRAALKRLPKSIRDLSLDNVEAAIPKHNKLTSRIRLPEEQSEEGSDGTSIQGTVY